MKALLIRLQEDDKQTLGQFYLWDGIDLMFQGKTLELPWRDNERMVSSIPKGEYEVKRRVSKKYGHHFIVKDVPGRDYILIHPGNFYADTKGCILVGQKFVDIDGDGRKDIAISRPTLEKLLAVAPKKFTLKIL